MTDRDTPAFEGASTLTAAFGHWPSFHDAEVLAIRLDRGDGSPDPRIGSPRLEADLYVFEMTGDVTPDGVYRIHKHTIATLGFFGIDRLEIGDFNNQNALFGLRITDIADRQLERLKWEVSFDPSYGGSARFMCESVAVLDVRALDGPPSAESTPRQSSPRRPPS